jgi:hypothetical protein
VDHLVLAVRVRLDLRVRREARLEELRLRVGAHEVEARLDLIRRCAVGVVGNVVIGAERALLLETATPDLGGRQELGVLGSDEGDLGHSRLSLDQAGAAGDVET